MSAVRAGAGYIHTFAPAEQERLRTQAEFLEPHIFPTSDFSACREVLEVGCGVGAQDHLVAEEGEVSGIAAVDAALGHHPVHRDVPALRVNRIHARQFVGDTDHPRPF